MCGLAIELGRPKSHNLLDLLLEAQHCRCDDFNHSQDFFGIQLPCTHRKSLAHDLAS